ncbi:hypothetical protein ABT275_45885 [Streptomyces sp. NPDC001185]|uniref:hypothetical protein n=1 Tax=Streptomyces sp. NPDC001185 TaxID=3154380 RepID=UPI00332B1D69
MEYRYVRVKVFGASRTDLQTETTLSEEDIRSAYEEQPVYIDQDATSMTVTFDDAGPSFRTSRNARRTGPGGPDASRAAAAPGSPAW